MSAKLVVIFILGYLLNFTSGSPVPEAGCLVAGVHYDVGETFYTPGPTPYSCTQCTCFNVIPLCNDLQCPPTHCTHTIVPEGECCPICIRPDILPEYQQCTFNGETIEHEETFFPSLSETGGQDLNLTANSACNECTCFDGAISCKDLSMECPSLQCQKSEAVIIEGTCCPVCPGVTVEPTTQGGGCSVGGEWYPNGATWHPIYPGHGRIPCINCTCRDSQDECIPLPCPTEPLPICTPEDPIEEITLCCPKCRRPAPTTTMAPIPCHSTHTVRVWQHTSEDAVAAEMTDMGMVRSYRWSSVNGEYVREERDLSVADFSTAGYRYWGRAKQSRLNGLRTRANKAQRIEECSSDCADLIIRLLRVDPSCPA